MAKLSTEVTVELLQAFANAWNRHDVDDLMSFMTDDCVFESSAGDGHVVLVTWAQKQFE